ncbi:hypothetical protein D3C73_1624130 [compost metagenome]
MSGVLTDLGLALGYRLRGLNVDRRRIILHLVILFGFFLGGLVASMIYPNSFLVPALLSWILSIVYWVIYFRYRRIQE